MVLSKVHILEGRIRRVSEFFIRLIKIQFPIKNLMLMQFLILALIQMMMEQNKMIGKLRNLHHLFKTSTRKSPHIINNSIPTHQTLTVRFLNHFLCQRLHVINLKITITAALLRSFKQKNMLTERTQKRRPRQRCRNFLLANMT